MSDDVGSGGRSGAGDTPQTPPAVRLTAWVAGHVHGVGFRWWVRCRALELALVGVAENLDDGRVKVIAEGSEDSCRKLLAALEGPGTPGRVVRVTQRWDQPRGGLAGFVER